MNINVLVSSWYSQTSRTDSQGNRSPCQPTTCPITGIQQQDKHIHIPNIYALCGIGTHDPGFRASEDSTCLKLGIDCARLLHAAVRARQTRSFFFTVFVSSIEERQPRVAVDRRCSSATRPSQLKDHSTLKSLCRGAKNRSDFVRHAPSSRAAVWYLLCEAKQRILPCAAAARNWYPTLDRSTTVTGVHRLSQGLLHPG
jgi:hypothetical protein